MKPYPTIVLPPAGHRDMTLERKDVAMFLETLILHIWRCFFLLLQFSTVFTASIVTRFKCITLQICDLIVYWRPCVYGGP